MLEESKQLNSLAPPNPNAITYTEESTNIGRKPIESKGGVCFCQVTPLAHLIVIAPL
jgi:hypothetical protein